MVEILRGSAATQAIASPAFQSRWSELYQACPWGTVFQDIPFVTAWHSCYADEYEPVVVCDTAASGGVEGLLFLAVSRETSGLVPCGAAQAEYDVWLARPESGVAFIEAAWAALAREFPHGRIDFLFLPPNTPIAFSREWQARCFVRKYPRPLRDTTPASDAVQVSLKKKGNKSKLKQLQRLGAFTFQRITDPLEFDALLDEMIPIFDSRQLALSGTAPFRDDPRRRRFLHEMLRLKILHVTAMRVAGRLVAAHLGQINGHEVLLGMIAHSPFFAKYSVGKFQLLLLASELQKEGFQAFDLTPSGDYKDRFATHHDEAHILTVCLSTRSAERYRLRRRVIDVGKRYLSSVKVKEAIAIAQHKVRLLRPSKVPVMLLRRATAALVDRREFRVYVMEATTAASRPTSDRMHRDVIDDLFLYEPVEPSQPPKDDFMRIALARLGSGQHFYSRVEDGRLVHWGWLIDHEAISEPTEIGEPLALPVQSAVLFDFYTRPEYRGRGLYGRALGQCIADAGRVPNARHVVISVLADNTPSRRAIEKAGFEHWFSLFRRRLLWHTRRWRTTPGRSFPVPEVDSVIESSENLNAAL